MAKYLLGSRKLVRKVIEVKRVLEIVFAHKLLLAVPLVAALVGTAGFLFVQPGSYQSSATIWVSGGGVGTQSAAQAQADIITQFLKTNAFASAVASNSPLGAYLSDHPGVASGTLGSLFGQSGPPSTDAVRAYLASHVTITQLGPAEMTLTVTAPTPDTARGTADALTAQLLKAEVAAKTTPTTTQLALYQSQLQDQSAALNTDLAAVRAYLTSHPGLVGNPSATATDAQLAILQDRAAQDQQSYLTLLGKISQAQSDLAAAQEANLAPFRTVDAPQTPSSQGFGRQQLLAVAAGVLAGLLAVIGLGALLVRLDSTIHTTDEVLRMTGLKAIGATPLSAEV